jgi:8-oxo-dGTP diphosphatase
MKYRKRNKGKLVMAAGGIVVRPGRDPQIAVVQLRKADTWTLPKGKLSRGESALAAARREVLEETGYRVSIHEFLGTLAYEARGHPKIVQFWRMQADGGPVAELMHDVQAVEWLPLDAAVARLTHPRERAFLANVGPIAVRPVAQPPRRPLALTRASRKRAVERARALPAARVPAPVASAAAANAARSVLERTWKWFRQQL